jgi:phosphatidylethanolamine N-methyltransferase
VPPTQDILQALFFPNAPQTIFEWSVLAILALEFALFFVGNLHQTFFMGLFIFWRCAYDLGLGFLLDRQSDTQLLVRMTKKYGFGPNAGKRRGPWAEYFVNELKKKMNLTDEEYSVRIVIGQLLHDTHLPFMALH